MDKGQIKRFVRKVAGHDVNIHYCEKTMNGWIAWVGRVDYKHQYICISDLFFGYPLLRPYYEKTSIQI